jgi:hypothetical protein
MSERGHVAVVPIGPTLDQPTLSALAYARLLTPEVLAIQIRGAGGADLDTVWQQRVPTVPLVSVEPPQANWKPAFVRVVRELWRTRGAERVTVVLPQDSELKLSLRDRLQLGVRSGGMVSVRTPPGS